jgi:membrane associated rhomboid family serine protease
LIELNYILLFLAITSPLAVLAGALRGGGSPSWRAAAIAVLAITGVGWMFFRKDAGYIGGAAWIALLFLPAIGLRRVAELSAGHQYRSARKLAATLQWLHPSRELRRQVEIFRALEARQASGHVPPPPTGSSGSWIRPSSQVPHAPVVIGLIALNVITYLVELACGAVTDTEKLLRLGALYPSLVTQGHQYWRLLTAVFLHYGMLHLLFNVFALYVLGPALERVIGGTRFLACYLISGIGSSAGVVLLTAAHILDPAELAGASGCVMGVVGAWAAYLLRHRHMADASRRLNSVFMIILIQTVFDIVTPHISMSAHLCGLATGFFLGLFMTRTEGLRFAR